jgi:polysaccharide export outer membrane protein
MTRLSGTQSISQALLVAAALLVGLSPSGCSSSKSKYQDLKVFLQAHRHDVAGVSYRLEPPDVIQIESPSAPEVDRETQRIRSDGKIALRLLGEIQIAGLTPEEVAVKLEGLLEKYYESPSVTVRVAAYESKNVYAFGQVGRRGAFPFTGRDTLLDIIAAAQPNFIAWGEHVKVIRPSANPDERHEITVDVDKMLKEGDLTNNFLLQEGDIVYVPPTPTGWLGMRVQEIMFPVSPALSMYNSPVQARNTTEDYQYGGYQNLDDRRRLVWNR